MPSTKDVDEQLKILGLILRLKENSIVTDVFSTDEKIRDHVDSSLLERRRESSASTMDLNNHPSLMPTAEFKSIVGSVLIFSNCVSDDSLLRSNKLESKCSFNFSLI